MSKIDDMINQYIQDQKDALLSIDSVNATIRFFKRLQFGRKAQLAFLEDLYTLIADGIPPNRAIEMLNQVLTGAGKDVADYISKKISEGQGLAEGMRAWFSIEVVEIIRVGEEGGALAETMKSGINSMKESSSTMGAFIGAIVYPLMVILMSCCIIIYLNTSVFVQFAAIKPMSQWPAAGRQLVAIAQFIQGWWWTVVVGMVVFIIVLRRMLSNYVGEFRPMLDKVPPFIFYRRITAARFMETLGLLVSNGVVVKNALKVMQYQATPYLGSHLVMMEHLLGMGRGNIADVLSTGLIDDKDILRLRVMAEVKGFEHGLVRMGVHGAEDTVRTLKILGKIIGGILLGVGAVLIVVIVRGIFLTGMAMGAQ